jgi:phosphohistidine phosphatase SixA
MAVEFEFRRHSIKDGPAKGMIGPKGFALARDVGRLQLRNRGFTHFFASSLWRTHQTLAAFDEGAGDLRFKATPEHAGFYLDWPELMVLWRVCADGANRGEDMLQTALFHDPALANRTVVAVAEKFREWAKSFPDNSRILVVGHSPYMELIPVGLLNVIIPGLKECQGFRITVYGDLYTVDWLTPNLDPAQIRKNLFPDSSK